jgi:hypothetical protein
MIEDFKLRAFRVVSEYRRMLPRYRSSGSDSPGGKQRISDCSPGWNVNANHECVLTHRSTTMSFRGWLQQIKTLPSAGA